MRSPIGPRRSHGQRPREPLLQPHDDQRRGPRQRLRHQGLGHPLQDGAAGADPGAGPDWATTQPARKAAAQPATAAPLAGRGAGGEKGSACIPLFILWCRILYEFISWVNSGTRVSMNCELMDCVNTAILTVTVTFLFRVLI